MSRPGKVVSGTVKSDGKRQSAFRGDKDLHGGQGRRDDEKVAIAANEKREP